jgi:hypothetical protein
MLLPGPVTPTSNWRVTKKGANQNDDGEDEEIIESRTDDNGPNNVRDKEFKSRRIARPSLGDRRDMRSTRRSGFSRENGRWG